ncbi:MAG TPA: Mut7-C RNAse domain-containing protein [Candidatus Udaeobacter sp.]|nr:Mut7-C RNAse domain-containing protein [Candidatus Udaeobacter sp.]
MPTPTHELRIDVASFTVRLNLHGDLDFFLRSGARGRSVERSLSEKTSVKDVIEACGIPHPEIDLIVVNEQPVDFNHAIASDADIELYPVGALPPEYKYKSLQIATVNRFVADGHLGRLARDLRLLGFDVAYDPQAADRQLLHVMERENRALLTRDRRLLMHAVVRTGYCPRSQNAVEQTIEVICRFDLAASISPFTRCLRCNAPLRKVSKAEVIEKLEPLTKIYYEEFRRCTGCGQIYWAGSHFSKLQKRLEQIRARCTTAYSDK